MNQGTSLTNPSSDDIDLLLLLERILLFFKRYKWVFILSAVTGLTLGILVYSNLPNTYRSKLVIHSYFLTNQENIKIIENWNSLLRKQEYDELAATLNCKKEVFGKIKKISAEEIQKVFSVSNPNGFTVEVIVTDNAVLDDFQKAMVYGLENTGYVKQRLESKRENLKELIGKTTLEISRLDSTKKIMENILEGRSKSSSSLIIEGATINKQLIEMNEKRLGYMDDLKFTSSVQVYQGFSKFSKPTGPHLLAWLVIGLLIFIPIGFVISFLHSINDKLKKRSLLSKQATRERNI